MRKKEIDQILNEKDYSWIKVKKFIEPSSANPMVEWQHEYNMLNKHHIEETEFLINKCRELADYIKKHNILI